MLAVRRDRSRVAAAGMHRIRGRCLSTSHANKRTKAILQRESTGVLPHLLLQRGGRRQCGGLRGIHQVRQHMEVDHQQQVRQQLCAKCYI